MWKNSLKIDWNIIQSVPFSAIFEKQQYIGDKSIISVSSWDGRNET